jgi:hypothetical protein
MAKKQTASNPNAAAAAARKAAKATQPPAAGASAEPTLTDAPPGSSTQTKDGGTLTVIKDSTMPKDFKFKVSDRPVEEIIESRVLFNEAHTSVQIEKDTPLEEVIPILDYFQGLAGHVGFFIGDVMIAASDRFNERFGWAMEKTGRAASTLRGYEATARAIPPEVRSPMLTYTHHVPLARLHDVKDIKAMLKEAEPAKGRAMLTVNELRDKVNEKFPKPAKKAGKASSGKKKKGKAKGKEIKPYEPTDEEKVAIDGLFDAMKDANSILSDKVTPNGKTWAQLYLGVNKAPGMDNAKKRALLDALKSAWELYQKVSFKLGY